MTQEKTGQPVTAMRLYRQILHVLSEIENKSAAGLYACFGLEP